MGKPRLNPENWLIALAVFSVLAFLFSYPILQNFGNWGIHDWDQHMFYNEAPRKTILEYGQFPLWNPYYCGGNALLAYPQSMFLSPFFTSVLLFGTVYGVKIEIMLHLIVGMFGMFLLARHFKLGKYSSYLPPILFMMSSWYALRVAVGHSIYFSMAFIPYAFLFYLKAYEKWKYCIVSALFLALIVFAGGTYPFYFALMLLGFYTIFEAIVARKARPVLVLAAILIIAFLFGAVKIIPMMDFLGKNSYPQNDIQYTSAGTLYRALLSRNQDLRQEDTRYMTTHEEFEDRTALLIAGKLPWGWHEYGAYIGVIGFLLFVVGAFVCFKKNIPLVLTSIVFLVLAMGDKLILWNAVHLLPVLSGLHGPSRFIMVFVFCGAILAGIGLSRLEKKEKITLKSSESSKKEISSKYIVLLILLLIAADLFLVGTSVLKEAFTVTPKPVIQNTEYFQVAVVDEYKSMFPNALMNLGTVTCYERMHPDIKAIPKIRDDGAKFTNYQGEAYIVGKNGNITQKIADFSPNKFVINLQGDFSAGDVLVLNQNYDSGWKTQAGGKKEKADNFNGLVAKELSGEEKDVVFYYLPDLFLVGLVISIVSFVAFGVLYFKRNKSKSKIEDTAT